MESILKMSGVEIAEKIRLGKITSIEAVSAHIKHIKKVNPTLNAVVKDRFAEAQKEAEKADKKLKTADTKKLPPFFGVPCTIKECFALKGMPNASGLLARKDIISEKDAVTVERIRKSGAIPMGVTNTSELCMWMESFNKVYGRTNNPYDPKRIVGGSSGGEGAIIGAGGSPFGLGSDIGGSIRMPAFFNGVFGHKPSGGLVPGTGQYPVAVNEALRYLSTGPLARKAEDLWPLLNILAGPDGVDTGCTKMNLGNPDNVDFSKIRVLVVKDNGKLRVKPDMRDALLNAAGAFEKLGAKVEMKKFDGLKDSLNIWSSMLSAAGGASFAELMGQGDKITPFGEMGKWILRKSPFTLPAISLAILELFPKKFPNSSLKSIERGKALREEMTQAIGSDGIMLYPSYPTVAPHHYVPMVTMFYWVYTAILNVMELPVTQVPMGLNESGVPLGVQVAAINGNDHLTIAGALALEKEIGGWVPPKFD